MTFKQRLVECVGKKVEMEFYSGGSTKVEIRRVNDDFVQVENLDDPSRPRSDFPVENIAGITELKD